MRSSKVDIFVSFRRRYALCARRSWVRRCCERVRTGGIITETTTKKGKRKCNTRNERNLDHYNRNSFLDGGGEKPTSLDPASSRFTIFLGLPLFGAGLNSVLSPGFIKSRFGELFCTKDDRGASDGCGVKWPSSFSISCSFTKNPPYGGTRSSTARFRLWAFGIGYMEADSASNTLGGVAAVEVARL